MEENGIGALAFALDGWDLFCEIESCRDCWFLNRRVMASRSNGSSSSRSLGDLEEEEDDDGIEVWIPLRDEDEEAMEAF